MNESQCLNLFEDESGLGLPVMNSEQGLGTRKAT